MIAHILLTAGIDPLVFIGAPVPAFAGANYHFGAGPLVLEADEYDRTFLQYQPNIAVITNIEPEHLDYYTSGLPEILEAFATFVDRLKPGGQLIINGDSDTCRQLIKRVPSRVTITTFGRRATNEYQIQTSELRATPMSRW